MASVLRQRQHGARQGDPKLTATVTQEQKQETTGDGHAGLMSLPPELHYNISQLLTYPDALSLKHTSRYFYGAVDTGVKLKVDWLMERRKLHLECPNDRACDLGTDLRFCRGSVPLLMKRRREHIECNSRPDLGCLVYGTTVCTHRQQQSRWRRWFGKKFTLELWWILLALVPLLFCWTWLMELARAM